MKYPLTEGAKEGAKSLISLWDRQLIEQYILVDLKWFRGKTTLGYLHIDDYDPEQEYFEKLSEEQIHEDWIWELPPAGVLYELAQYGLISVSREKDGNGKQATGILLLQELRNAVENNFEVSDYFLTMNAVGTIVQGNLTIHPGGIMQSAASNTGNIEQNIEQLADDLIAELGMQFVQSNAELRQAIEGLRTATEGNKQSKLGKVISELGRCLGHTANATAIAAALIKLAPYII